MEYLTQEDLILINKMTVNQHGGNFVPPSNLLNPNSLEYVVEAVKGEMFGEELYPEIQDKAAVYMFSIISNHVFQDGNKRTGLGSALLFLKLNGYKLKEELVKVELDDYTIPEKGEDTNAILFHFVMEVASGTVDLEDSRHWFKQNIMVIEQ